MDEPIIDKPHITTRGQRTLKIQQKEEYSAGIRTAKFDMLNNSFILGLSAIALITSIVMAATDYKEHFSLFEKVFSITLFGANSAKYLRRTLDSIAKKAKYKVLSTKLAQDMVMAELAKGQEAMLSDMARAELGNVSEESGTKKQGR